MVCRAFVHGLEVVLPVCGRRSALLFYFLFKKKKKPPVSSAYACGFDTAFNDTDQIDDLVF